MSFEVCALCDCPSPRRGYTCNVCHAVLHLKCVRAHGPCHGERPPSATPIRPSSDYGTFNPPPSEIDWTARWQWLIAGYAVLGPAGAVVGLATSASDGRLAIYVVCMVFSLFVAVHLLTTLRSGVFSGGTWDAGEGYEGPTLEFEVTREGDPMFFDTLTTTTGFVAAGLAALAWAAALGLG